MSICDCGCGHVVGSTEFQKLHVKEEDLEVDRHTEEEQQPLEWSDLD